MRIQFVLQLLFIFSLNTCISSNGACNQVSSTTKDINWLFVNSTLKHANYSAQQIEKIIETLHQAEEYGLTAGDLQTDDQILSQAKYIFEFENGSLKWKVIAGGCVITAVIVVIVALYSIDHWDGLEKKYNNKLIESNALWDAHHREEPDRTITLNTFEERIHALHEDTLKIREENEKLRKLHNIK